MWLAKIDGLLEEPMSYISQGLSLTDLESAISKGKEYLGKTGDAAKAAMVILEDPAFPQVTGIVLDINRIEVQKRGPSAKGVGLSGLVGPLKFYRETRRTPGLLYAAAIAAVGVPFLIGYVLGGR